MQHNLNTHRVTGGGTCVAGRDEGEDGGEARADGGLGGRDGGAGAGGEGGSGTSSGPATWRETSATGSLIRPRHGIRLSLAVAFILAMRKSSNASPSARSAPVKPEAGSRRRTAQEVQARACWRAERLTSLG